MTSPIPAKKIKSSLLAKGFIEEEKRGHKQLRLYIDGKKTGISTSISRGTKRKIYEVGLLKYMAKGLRLDLLRQLLNLIECPMSHTQYVTYLRQKGYTL